MKVWWLIVCCIVQYGCHHNIHLHKQMYYDQMEEDEIASEGYHANEAHRILDYKTKNKLRHKEEEEKKKEKLQEDLNNLNKPNEHSSKQKKLKKKKFDFYM